MVKTVGLAAQSSTSPMSVFHFERRPLRKHDVLIDILYCGICHSDLHTVRNEWKKTIFPVVPGHEIVGRVSAVGGDVTAFKPGDLVGVGCIIGCCQQCPSCQEHLEQYCDKGFTLVFNTVDAKSGAMNYGGFSKQIVVEDRYVVRIPKKYSEKDLPALAPLLCAGITTYSPLKHWGVGKGTQVGIVGLGGLGHMAVKLAHAMGAHVVVFTTSPGKVNEAKKLGADEVVISSDAAAMQARVGTLDFILDTVAYIHDLNSYTALLKRDGALCLVGLPEKPYETQRADLLIGKRRSIAGSLIGSIAETQELLDFCAQHNVAATIELIAADKVDEAFERMVKSDVKYRFVIDMATLPSP